MKRARFLAVLIILVVLTAFPVSAGDDSEEDKLQVDESLLSRMELDNVQAALDELLKEQDFSFIGTVRRLMSGAPGISVEECKQFLGNLVLGEFMEQKRIIGYLLILVLAAAMFHNFSDIFGSGQLGETSFYMVYLLVFVLLVKGFSVMSRMLQIELERIVEFMKALAPAYYLSVAASTGTATASGFYQLILILFYLVEKGFLYLLLPGIHIYVLLQLVNHLSKEDFLSKMAELIKSILLKTMRTVLGMILGLQLIQNLVAPSIDSLKRTALGRTAGVIPGIGNAFTAATETVIGSAVLIRNCVGATAIIALILAGMIPLVRLTITAFVYRLMAAVSQPVADKRFVNCLNTMGEGCGMLMKLLINIEVLFILTIAILAGTMR